LVSDTYISEATISASVLMKVPMREVVYQLGANLDYDYVINSGYEGILVTGCAISI
jgi:hypothetical protein